jgi:E3 ubiquitin-protein ligase FANCL
LSSENCGDDVIRSNPKLSSLCVIPIMTDHDSIAAGLVDDEEIVIPLLSRDETVSTVILEHHPCDELIQTARRMEKQLHERLSDASSEALNNIRDDHKQLGIYEEFLQQCEAIVKELLGAIQQHLRKEQTALERTRAKNSRKRNDSIQSTAMLPPPLNFYAMLLKQLKVLDNMPNVTEINLHDNGSNDNHEDVTRLSVTCVDRKQRNHTWNAQLYPTIILTLDLPEEFTLVDDDLRLEKWWHDDKHDVLVEIQKRFQQGIDIYQPLFDELDQLDANLWVLEPSLPARRSSVERRIALWEGGASLVLVLDAEKPRAAPTLVRFVGLTVAAMKAAQASKGDRMDVEAKDWSSSFAEFIAEGGKDDSAVKHWSESRSVQENLELWFGAQLPSPLTSSKSDYLVECGICYTHRFPTEDVMADDGSMPQEEGSLPDVKCSNATCNRHYHESCLFEWLHSLPTAKNSFERIFGSCPYCCDTISVSTVKGRHK